MSPPQGDEGELFARYHRRLVRATAYLTRASHENVEEACAFAWAHLLAHDVRRETVFGWLKEVARREAIRLEQVDRGLVPLGKEAGELDLDLVEVPSGNPAVTTERWEEALSRLQRLPERDRRVVAMRAFGWKYHEIASELGISLTRVDQLLARADAHLRELQELEHPPSAPRAARLRRLEAEPPRWLRDAIGARPKFNRRRGDSSARIREWRRLAVAIDDYRATHGVHDPRRALGPAARSRDQRVQRDELRARIDRFMLERGGLDR